MHTEDEAKTKFCPQFMSRDSNNSFFQGYNCIASECMAWRWASVENPDFVPLQTPHQWPEPPDTRTATQRARTIKSDGAGFCGLSGGAS